MAHTVERVTLEDPATAALERTGRLQRAGRSLGVAAGKIAAKVHAAATRIAEQAEKVKEEKPLQLLAVLAGFAAVAGFTIRFWRVNRNA
jgi:hypothetical protein